MKLPIRVRLTAMFALLLTAILVAFAASVVLRLRSDLHSAIDSEVRDGSAKIARNWPVEGPAGFIETAADALPRGGAEAQALDTAGRVIASYGGTVAQHPMVSPAVVRRTLAGADRRLSLALGRRQDSYHALATPVARAGRRDVVVVAESVQSIDEAVERTVVLLLVAGPIALVTAGLVAWWLLRAALAPVERMRREAGEIGIDRLGERVAVPPAKDELRHLAETLNAMLDRLQRGVNTKRRLVADASHGLRTPLAVMRAEIDVSLRRDELPLAERELLESIREEVDRISRAVGNLLTIAEAEEGKLQIRRVELDLIEVAADAAASLGGLARAREIDLTVGGDPATAVGDPERLRLAVSNLIENAIKFTPERGSVTVAAWIRDGRAGVTVADTGAGIAPEALQHLFKRFYRVRARDATGEPVPGSGLGLAICGEIAAAHGGEMSARSEVGEGSAFTLELPAVGAPAVARPYALRQPSAHDA
jgi:two-component system OmpR family sensor kinase